MRSFGTVFFAVLLTLTTPGPGVPQPGSPARPGHPAVDPGESCEGCHARVTPAIHAAWAGSRHAAAVGCVACHGAPGADFKPRPAASVCASCHQDQAGGLSPDLQAAGRTCFTCHPPHALSPHRRPAVPRQAMPVH